MIFAGDIALPYKNAINYYSIPNLLLKKNWYANIEGAITPKGDNHLRGVYNHNEAVAQIFQDFNFTGVSLSNNHIFDMGYYQDTLDFLDKQKIKYGGIGNNITDANKEIVLKVANQQIVIINFGWEVIQCEITTGAFPGVNPLRKNHVLKTTKSLIKKYPDAKIIPFMHWSYELENTPQPFERKLAHHLIDMGVAGVIGCHPHRIGGFERYNNKPIVYSLGNFLFKQNHYYNNKLKFPDFCNKELVFEWDFTSDTFVFHILEYNQVTSVLKYVKEMKEKDFVKKYSPFNSLSHQEYKKWYRQNHYHKSKGLPVYYWEDNDFKTILKNKWVKMRDKGIKLILNKGK